MPTIIVGDMYLPTYTTKKFGVFVLSSLIIAVVIISLVGWGIQSLLRESRTRVYFQLIDQNSPAGKISVNRWATINHTVLILSDSVVESILKVTAKQSPTFQNITIKIDLDDPRTYTEDDAAPQILEGDLSWSGKWNQDIHLNETITILTKLKFDFDGKYFVGGQVISSSGDGSDEGYGTSYYFLVEKGKTVRVTNELDQIPPSTEIETTKLSP